jgi:thiol-disulfide isomerase/thioredoxin
MIIRENFSIKNKSRLKGILNITLIILGIGFFVILFLFKDSMNSLVSKKMTAQTSPVVKESVAQFVDSAFNYKRNGKGYKMTFLEFGATGCIACKMMETVMEKVKISYPGEIQVNFINVLIPASQDLMKYYGVVAIPTQVLLNNEGEEVFRHSGYYSFNELTKEFQKINP